MRPKAWPQTGCFTWEGMQVCIQCSRVSNPQNGLPKPTERHDSQIYKKSKRSKRTPKLIPQKIFPKDPYRAKYAYFSKMKAKIDIMKVRSSRDAWTKPNFQP